MTEKKVDRPCRGGYRGKGTARGPCAGRRGCRRRMSNSNPLPQGTSLRRRAIVNDIIRQH